MNICLQTKTYLNFYLIFIFKFYPEKSYLLIILLLPTFIVDKIKNLTVWLGHVHNSRQKVVDEMFVSIVNDNNFITFRKPEI